MRKEEEFLKELEKLFQKYNMGIEPDMNGNEVCIYNGDFINFNYNATTKKIQITVPGPNILEPRFKTIEEYFSEE